MSENNLPNEGMENEEVNSVEETAEVNGEETADVYADVSEEATEEVSEEVEETVEEIAVEAPKKANGLLISNIIAWILAVVFGGICLYNYVIEPFNKYNFGEIDIYGQTIGDVAGGMGGSFEQFKEMYGLPADMKENTYINVAERYIKVSSMITMNQIDIDQFREMYNVGEEITEDSLMGEVTDSMTLDKYVGADNLDSFKEEYGFGDEVTLETKWGEIRKIVEKADYEKRLEQEKAAAEPTEAPAEESEDAVTEEATEETAETEAEVTEEVPAEEAPAEEAEVAAE